MSRIIRILSCCYAQVLPQHRDKEITKAAPALSAIEFHVQISGWHAEVQPKACILLLLLPLL